MNHSGPIIATDMRKLRLRPHSIWHLDEVYLKIVGQEEEVDAFDEKELAAYESADDVGPLPGSRRSANARSPFCPELAARPPEVAIRWSMILDWDENARIASWRQAVEATVNIPSLLAAAIALLDWEEIDPLQHKAVAVVAALMNALQHAGHIA